MYRLSAREEQVIRRAQVDAPWLKVPRCEPPVRVWAIMRVRFEDLHDAIAKVKADSGKPGKQIPAERTLERLRGTVAGLERQLSLPRKTRIPRTATSQLLGDLKASFYAVFDLLQSGVWKALKSSPKPNCDNGSSPASRTAHTVPPTQSA